MDAMRKNSGADEVSKGIGSVSLAECLDGMGAQPNTGVPATCAIGSGNMGDPPYTGQVMSPTRDRTFLSIHFMCMNYLGSKLTSDRMSPPTSVRRRRHRPQCPRGKNLMLRKNQSDSPGLGERETPQLNQPSHLPPSGPQTQSMQPTIRILVVVRAKPCGSMS